jgi:hypothetical protein
MRVAVVHESWFGNTRKVAEAIAEGLRREGDVVIMSVDDRPPAIDEFDLVVVGAPTHIHGLSSALSRRKAIEQGADVDAPGIGVRGWLEQLPSGGCRAAAFDTRFERSALVTGSAAKGIAKRLRRHGFELVAEPESFFVVEGEHTVLKRGELERAIEWGRALASRMPALAAAGR